MSIAAGTRLGRYEIRSKIGAGGMGEVYLAQDTELHRLVALKILPSEFTQSEQRLGRFRQEAYAASALNHPNIITIHEIGKTDSLHYLVTEFVDGQSLRQRLLKTLKLGETLDIATQIASALSAAHAAGIIHRDIKPENIMLRQDGIVKVLDFGVARVMIAGAVESEAETQSLLTTPGTILGTMPYMSPEQLRGEVLDGRSDIFSFGVVLYEMLSGRQPFASGSAATTISAILNEEPPALLRYAPDLPEELQRIARKCLEKDRNLRYQHASEVRADLQRLKRDTESAQMAITAKPEAKTEADAPPTGNKAVYAFLELFALAFTFEGASALLRGESLWKIAGAWLVAVIFFVAGIRWPKIRLLLEQRFGSKRERIAPHGIAPDTIANVPRDRTGVTFTPRNLIVPAAAVVLAFLAAAYFYSPRAGYWFFLPRSASVTPIESLAVLPFVNASGDAEVEYLSDGITESLINSLSQLPNVSVKARSSVFRYKGREVDPQQVAADLSVQAILNGRLVQRGNDLTLYLSLVDGRNGNQIWGDQYDRKLAELVTLQNEIARDVSQKLRARLSGADERKVAKTYTANSEAYQLYLKGRYHLLKLTLSEIQTAFSYFQQAIAIDPSYALAYVGLADAYRSAALAGDLPPTEFLPKAKAAAQKAVEIDDGLADAHAELGFIIFWYDWDWNAAENQYKRALELDPNSADTHLFYAHLLSDTGRHAEALAEARRARELDPLNLRTNALEGQFLVYAGRTEEALARLRSTLELDPNSWFARQFAAGAYIEKGMYPEAIAEAQKARAISGASNTFAIAFLGYALAKSGKEAEARAVLGELLKSSTERYISSYNIALIYNGLGERDETLVWLERGYEQRDQRMVFLKVEPKWNNLRSDPRFQDLLRRVGFTP